MEGTMKHFIIFSMLLFLTVTICFAEVTSKQNTGRAGQVASKNENLKKGKEGEVTPLTQELLTQEEGVKRVPVTGSAAILGGNVQRAKKGALLEAYRIAVNTMMGVEIESLTMVKNCEEFTSLVVEKSRGYIRSYKILSEDIDEKSQIYTVIIEAEVVEGNNMRDNKDEIALRAYLELIENPVLIILLSDRGTGVPSGTLSGAVSPGVVEIALAKRFQDVGYAILTADDLFVGDFSTGPVQDWLKHRSTGNARFQSEKISEEELLQAREGYTAMARQVGRKSGADLVICGIIKVAGGPVYGAGTNRMSVTSYVKTVVCSTGQVLNINIKRIVDASYDNLPQKLAEVVGEELMWQIPKALTQNAKELKITLTNATLDDVAVVEKTLRERKDIESIIMSSWNREKGKPDRGRVDFTITTSFLGPTAERIYEDLVGKTGQVVTQPIKISKFEIELKVAE